MFSSTQQWHQLVLLSLHVLHLIFAAIGNAFAVLSDTQKRKRYDEYGNIDDTELRRRRHPNGYEYDFSRGFEGKLTVTRLCSMFNHCYQSSHNVDRKV